MMRTGPLVSYLGVSNCGRRVAESSQEGEKAKRAIKRGSYSQWTWRDLTRGKTRVIPKMALEAPPRFPWRSACCQAPAVRGGAAPSPEPPPTAQQAVCTERGFPRLPGEITGQTPHQLPSQPENCSRRRSGCRLLHRMLRSLRSLRRPPSTPEKWTFQLCLDTRIDITAPLGDDGSDTTAHSCSVVASAATSTVHHSVATSPRAHRAALAAPLGRTRPGGTVHRLSRGALRGAGAAHSHVQEERQAAPARDDLPDHEPAPRTSPSACWR